MSASRRFTVFAVAAVLVSGALALTAALVERADIESELTARAQEALAQSRLPTDVVTFSGRDATVRADSRREALLAKAVIDEVDGVRSVEIAAPKSASEPHAERKAGLQRGIDEALADTPITFAADSANLDAAGRQAVKNVADLLTEAPTDWRFEIAGHVARVPGAEPESARKLSYERAEAVAEELVKSGLPPDRVEPVGYGATRPLSDSGTSSIDRRVEITVR
ncbi:OmpA family protein [Saccharomonospora viridis]|uniref:OmpA family protein n=1 Tax=Saccharomonospora viridis TaxID=1852 RepID=UPI00240960F0|nr:OmpA family protein [Saccharomonospora viridis]